MTRPLKITRLLSADDHSEVSSWLGDPEHLIIQEAYEVIADWTNSDLDDVDFRDEGQGDFFFVQGAPVAFFAPPVFRRAA